MNGFSAIVLKPESETDSLGLLMHSVGGVPLLLRTFLALQRAGCEHIIYLDDDPDGGLKALQRDKRVRARIEWLPPEALKEAKLEKGQIAIVPSNTVFDYQILRELDDLDESGCLKISESGILICGAGRAAEFCQNPSLSDLEGGETVEFTTDRYWHRIQSEDDIRPALQQIYKSLADNEGGLEGFLDHVISRRFSILFTRMLIPFPISPNLVTCLSFLTGLVALYFFSLPGYMNKIWGAVLLQVSAVIDHSDGEIARLKFQTSRFGGTLDLVLDQIIYTLLMLAIGLGVAADHGQTYFWLGVACSFGSLMGCLYTTINQLFETRILALVEKPEEEVVESESKFSRMIETFGTREFGYYLLFVTAIDKLHWLLWVFAIGVQFFWIILTVLYLTEHRKARKAVANA
ncbi:MAG: CDP-alcohol phosphatidyltransferase family protein [Planctomycetota bacterium]|nr:CDP-alcohol phosphatidyltransferase family protein [Planctomycetota bacterium]